MIQEEQDLYHMSVEDLVDYARDWLALVDADNPEISLKHLAQASKRITELAAVLGGKAGKSAKEITKILKGA